MPKPRKKSVRKGSGRGWNLERNNALMSCLFSGLPVTGPFGLLSILGTSWKGVDRQLYKVIQNYTEGGRRSSSMVSVDLQLARKGKEWTPYDHWVLCVACNRVGVAHGADDPSHLSRCLGRSVSEIKQEMSRIVGVRTGFGLLPPSNVVYRNLKDHVAGVTEKIHLHLAEYYNHGV